MSRTRAAHGTGIILAAIGGVVFWFVIFLLIAAVPF